MADNSTSNSCAYCLKPVADNFICPDCMKERNVSVERIGVPSEELVGQQTAPSKPSHLAKPENKLARGANGGTRAADTKTDSGETTSKKRNVAEWKKVVLHSDFQAINSRANLVTYALFVPVAIVGFGVTTMFGFPFPLAGIAAIGLAVGWVIFRSEQKAWYHYATWVFSSGQSLECDVDVVSSGELDQPYIVLKDENRLSHAYDTKVFKVVVGDTTKLFTEHRAPGAKLAFRVLAHFERKPQEHAIIFELENTRLWCKPHLSRGF